MRDQPLAVIPEARAARYPEFITTTLSALPATFPPAPGVWIQGSRASARAPE
jgi:hypothetical protein